MAKHFVTVLSNGFTYGFTKADPWGAANFVRYDDQQKFFLAGVEVTPEAFYSEARALIEAWNERKGSTHRLVRVRHGSSVLSFVWKWIPIKKEQSA
jgi:hypothetical protein